MLTSPGGSWVRRARLASVDRKEEPTMTERSRAEDGAVTLGHSR
jgi:hypothetical protein